MTITIKLKARTRRKIARLTGGLMLALILLGYAAARQGNVLAVAGMAVALVAVTPIWVRTALRNTLTVRVAQPRQTRRPARKTLGA